MDVTPPLFEVPSRVFRMTSDDEAAERVRNRNMARPINDSRIKEA